MTGSSENSVGCPSGKGWGVPRPVDDVTLAFPASVMSALMPPYDVCVAGLAELPDGGEQWRQFQRDWFYNGLPDTTQFWAVEGVDAEMAFRHLSAVQRSFEPKHQHKEAAVAYLASRWLTKIPEAN
jgi:hypothetical protein